LDVDAGGFYSLGGKFRMLSKTIDSERLEIHTLDFLHYKVEDVKILMPEKITSLLEGENMGHRRTLSSKMVNYFLENQERRKEMYKTRAAKDKIGFRLCEHEYTLDQLYKIVWDSFRYGQEG
jgi:Fe-S cluster biosynthesis and repair protein YggX